MKPTWTWCLLPQVLAHLRAREEPIPPTVYHSKSPAALAVPLDTWCVLTLAVQYFFVYGCLALASTCAELRGGRSGVLRVLLNGAQAVGCAPVLAYCFLMLEKPEESEVWMLLATYTVGASALLILLLPVLTGEIHECDEDGFLKSPQAGYGFWANATVALRYATIGALYTGVAGVLYALVGPETSSIAHCMVVLCVLYFVVSLAFALVRTARDLLEDSPGLHRALAATQVAFSVASLASMLGALFLAADLAKVPGTDWSRCFLGATYGLVAQTVLVIVGALFGGEPVRGRGDGDFAVANLRPSVYYAITSGRYVALLVTYGCLVAILVLSRPRSPAVINTFVLTAGFFLVYLALYMINTARDVSSHTRWPRGTRDPKEAIWIKWIRTVEAGRVAMQPCPMLAVLFLAVRMRALQLTDQRGGPQLWAQVCMWVCTSCCLLHLAFVLAVGASADRHAVDGGVGTLPAGGPAAALRAVLLMALYGALAGVLSSAFVLMPENASAA